MGSKSRILGGQGELSGVRHGVDALDSVNRMVGVLKLGNEVGGRCRRRVAPGVKRGVPRTRKFPADGWMRGRGCRPIRSR